MYYKFFTKFGTVCLINKTFLKMKFLHYNTIAYNKKKGRWVGVQRANNANSLAGINEKQSSHSTHALNSDLTGLIMREPPQN